MNQKFSQAIRILFCRAGRTRHSVCLVPAETLSLLSPRMKPRRVMLLVATITLSMVIPLCRAQASPVVCINSKRELVVQSKKCSGKLVAATISALQNRLTLTAGPQGPAGPTGSQGPAGISGRELTRIFHEACYCERR